VTWCRSQFFCALASSQSNPVQPSNEFAADTIQFLRAALDAIAPPNARETMAIIREEEGFAWVLAPPRETALPGIQPARPPDAPSLLHPTK